MDNNDAIKRRSVNEIVSPVDNHLQETFLNILLCHRWIILVTTLLSLIAAFLYLRRATPIYTSTSRLYVEQRGPKIINEYEGIMTQSKNYLYTQAELIKSTPIIGDAVDNPGLGRFRTFANVDNLTASVRKNLNVSVGKKDDIIAVSFDSPYPMEAAEIVNAVVGSYVSYQSIRKRGTVSEVLGILQKEKLKRDKELSNKHAEMLEFTRVNGVVSFDDKGGNIVFDRLAKLSSALTEAELATLNAKADFDAIKSMADEPAKIRQFAAASASAGVRVFVSDRETQLQSELRQAEIELKDTRYHCTEDHPSIQAIHIKIDRIKQELESQAKEFADAYIEVMRLRWITAKERKDELQASLNDQYLAARNLGVKAAEYSVLQSELNRSERICDILDNRIKELNITEDVGALNINILEAAHPANSPSKPKKARIMAIALVFGLVLGGGLAVLRDMTRDHPLRSADEISVVLGIPVLGAIPTMSDGMAIALSGHKVWGFLKLIAARTHRRTGATTSMVPAKRKSLHTQYDGKAKTENESPLGRTQRARSELEPTRWIRRMNKKANESVCTTSSRGWARSKAKTTAVGSRIAGKDKITSKKPDVIKHGQKAHLEPTSIVAEAFRTIRTTLFFSVPKEEAKTILITSPAPGDGKSTVVSNLAITMAQAGQKTLVIDADFRNPMQHNIFEIDSEGKKLSNIVAAAISLEEAIQPGPVKGLDIVRCSADITNPAELLNSDSFVKVLKEFSERYDRIIIDSPPVGPLADSQILSALCDVTLLVLRAEISTRRRSQQARDSLLSVGGHVLGAIVNDVRRRHGHYGYYSDYGYYHHHGYHSDRGKQKVSEG